MEELVVKEEEEAAPEGKERGFDHNAAPGQLSARLAGASKEVRFSHLPNPARSRLQLAAGAATGPDPQRRVFILLPATAILPLPFNHATTKIQSVLELPTNDFPPLASRPQITLHRTEHLSPSPHSAQTTPTATHAASRPLSLSLSLSPSASQTLAS